MEGDQVIRVTYTPGKSESWNPFIEISGMVYFTSNRDGHHEIYRLEESQSIRVTHSTRDSEDWNSLLD